MTSHLQGQWIKPDQFSSYKVLVTSSFLEAVTGKMEPKRTVQSAIECKYPSKFTRPVVDAQLENGLSGSRIVLHPGGTNDR